MSSKARHKKWSNCTCVEAYIGSITWAGTSSDSLPAVAVGTMATICTGVRGRPDSSSVSTEDSKVFTHITENGANICGSKR